SYAARSITQQRVLLPSGEPAPEVLPRHPRPDLALQEFAQTLTPILLPPPERQPLTTFLQGAAYRLGLRLAGESRDLGNEALDAKVLDVQRHERCVFHQSSKCQPCDQAATRPDR